MNWKQQKELINTTNAKKKLKTNLSDWIKENNERISREFGEPLHDDEDILEAIQNCTDNEDEEDQVEEDEEENQIEEDAEEDHVEEDAEENQVEQDAEKNQVEKDPEADQLEANAEKEMVEGGEEVQEKHFSMAELNCLDKEFGTTLRRAADKKVVATEDVLNSINSITKCKDWYMSRNLFTRSVIMKIVYVLDPIMTGQEIKKNDFSNEIETRRQFGVDFSDVLQHDYDKKIQNVVRSMIKKYKSMENNNAYMDMKRRARLLVKVLYYKKNM